MSTAAESRPDRVTIKEVAERAGVSRSTTSRALTGSGYTSEPVRQRVRRAAEELGYVVDANARGLKQRSSKVIGLLVSDLRNSFYAELAAGVGKQARASGYTMMLVDDAGNADDELGAARMLVASRVAGVVVTPVSAEASKFLLRQHIPVVEVDRHYGLGGVDAVFVDNRGAAVATTEHLLSLGHRRIAVMLDETDWTTGRDRRAGHAEALAAAGIEADPSLVVSAGWDADQARASAVAVLSSPERPTAVFAANNLLAEGVWRAAVDLGLAIPGDLSIVAFDDVPWMSMVNPGVTAVTQDATQLGEVAVDVLLQRIARPSLERREVMLPSGFIRRGSTGRPPR